MDLKKYLQILFYDFLSFEKYKSAIKMDLNKIF